MSEIPVLKTIIPLIPFQSVRKIFGNDNTIAQHSKQLLTDGKEDPGSHRNIFYGMINESEKDETSLTEIEVAYEAKNLIVAGSDTTAVTLTYLIWVVLSRPELHSKIKAELSTLGEDWAESQLEELPLLNATITETLRLYGAAPGGLPRTVPKEGATFSGYHIPGGMVVSTQCWTSHRDPALFPDPEKFDPSRWLPGQNEASEEARSAMSPFGSGSRICLGIHLAWMELRLATTEFFLGCGDVKLAPSVTEESMKPQHFFLIAPIAHKCEIMRASR
ncbi:cytochrome P450 [Penicillium angulare]|uniref:Cytochrome P450 n=1 Tax=Penicillium angulare TaxID=116970 RepID=A0A9W9FBF6_9EURO|nr:cytochrome P450 [Penicillium angulare]